MERPAYAVLTITISGALFVSFGRQNAMTHLMAWLLREGNV